MDYPELKIQLQRENIKQKTNKIMFLAQKIRATHVYVSYNFPYV